MLSIILFITILVLTVSAGFQDVKVVRPRQAPFECSVVAALLQACDIATPGILSAAETIQAECFCYESTTWIATAFDGAVATCANFAKTASPSDYPAIEAYAGFCTSVGDFINTPNGAAATVPPSPAGSPPPIIVPTTSSTLKPSASSPAIIVPAPTTTVPRPLPPTTTFASSSIDIFDNPGCSLVSFALSYCNSVSPGFSTLEPSSQAPCLCYSSTAWSPNGFDGPVQTCADYVSSADPAAYTDIKGIEGYCSSIGDITKDGNTEATTSKGSGTGGGIGAGGGGGGGGGVGLTLPGLGGLGGVPKTTSASDSVKNGQTTPTPTTTSKSTSVASNPTPVLTTSKVANSSSRLRLARTGVIFLGCAAFVLL